MRHRTSIIAAALILFIIVHLMYKSPLDTIPAKQSADFDKSVAKAEPKEKTPEKKPPLESKVDFNNENSILRSIRDYTIFFNGLEDFKPKYESIKGKYKSEKAKEKFSGSTDFLFTKKYLENVLDIPLELLNDLQEKHHRFVNNHLYNLLGVGISTFGSVLKTDPEWTKYRGSRGYVLVGGAEYSWLSYLVIKQIRATGSRIPIELFIAKEEEYEKDFCEKLLPLYDARCNLFDTALSDNLKERFNLGGYQYKMLAILSSKFENVLYIDSDNFPTRNIDYLFDSELYKKHGMILWPDAWARTTNPKFFDISGVRVRETKVRYSKYDYSHSLDEDKKVKPFGEFNFENSNYHDFEGTLPNPTSETGMFLINKTSHLRTLLLALYYNIFGPHYYYPLLTQGSAGEGDKETFIAAAHVVKEPWYQTKKDFKWTGYFSETDKQFKSKALGHYDPVQAQDEKFGDDTQIIFMHLSYPKYFPNWLVDNNDLIYKESGNHIRMYEAIYDNVGYDFDLRVFQLFTQGICPNYYHKLTGTAIDGESGVAKPIEYMGKYLKYVADGEEKNIERCEQVFIPHLKWLKETTRYPNTNVIV